MQALVPTYSIQVLGASTKLPSYVHESMGTVVLADRKKLRVNGCGTRT